MKHVIHFKSTKERLDYLKGNFEEIEPVEVKEETKAEPVEVEPIAKPKKKKASKKKEKKDDAVQAE